MIDLLAVLLDTSSSPGLGSFRSGCSSSGVGAGERTCLAGEVGMVFRTCSCWAFAFALAAADCVTVTADVGLMTWCLESGLGVCSTGDTAPIVKVEVKLLIACI